MTSRELVIPRIVGTGTASIATATTTNIDFGTPDDIKLAPGATFGKDDRLVLVVTADTTGTTDPISFSVQDADDSSGSIGTPATAVTTGTLTGGTGKQVAVIGIRQQPGRPWIRARVTRTGTTDTHKVNAVLLAFPHGF